MDSIWRVVVTYLVILIGLRVMGKREFSELSPLELVTLLLVPEIFSQAIIGAYSITNAIMEIATLFSIVYISSIVRHLNKKAAELIEGKPVVLVSHGQLVTPNLNLEHITPDEIFAEMHKAGLTRLDQVAWVVLEADGRMSIVPQDGERKGVIPQQATSRD